MMSIIGTEEQIDPCVEAIEQIGGALTGVLCGLPALGTNSLPNCSKVAAPVEQVEVGHRAVAQARNGMHGLASDDHYPQIEDLTSVCRLGEPLLDMHTLAAERVDDPRYLLVGL